MTEEQRFGAVTNPEAVAAMAALMPSADVSSGITRADIVILLRQVRTNLEVFLENPERARALREVLYGVAMDPEHCRRDIAARELLSLVMGAIDRQTKLVEIGDKMNRLDSGGATDRVEEIKRVILEGE